MKIPTGSTTADGARQGSTDVRGGHTRISEIVGTGYPQTERTEACIAVYLSFCMFVYGAFGFGFYRMFQPRHIPNPGLAAYRPFPATVMEYAGTANRFTYAEAAPPESASDELSPGRVAQVAASAASPVAPMPDTAPAE